MQLLNYTQKRGAIEARLDDFRAERSDEDIFAELCFCLLTPQSKAKSAWRAIENLQAHDLLLKGEASEVKKWLAGVRFGNNKAGYIVSARSVFADNGKMKVKENIRVDDIPATREWLVRNVKGYGMKEASHFLRNVGFGDDIAILDRHVLKHLLRNGVIDEIPKSLTAKRYVEIEGKMRKYAKRVGVPMSHLDLLWWSQETGEIFK